MPTSLAFKARFSRVHYAWVIVAVSFVTAVIIAGTLGISGVLLVSLQRDFGWQSSDISSAFGIRLALYGLLGPFSAALMNRFGVRRMVTIALFIILSGLAATIFVKTAWQFFIFWGLLTGVGTGLTAMVFNATVATRWFVKHRGLVTGILSASNATGQLIFLPALASVTETHGWKTTIIIACVAISIAIVAILLFMRDHPSDVGAVAYGETEPQEDKPNAAVVSKSLGSLLWTPITVLKEAARTPIFWTLFITFYICGASTNGLIQTHFVSLCGTMGSCPSKLRAFSR